LVLPIAKAAGMKAKRENGANTEDRADRNTEKI
jgi:hypothetical protein